ncbi:hypothetical protein ACFY1P_16055 [Streptomyces sp. NPDC001407]|uniref:hypothetical protein n=1 Tax=Streptomyces sp. NPDC001407 TaxID=3364573 RepID=UPI003680E23F
MPGVVGYLAVDPTSVTYLQWQADSTGSLKGTENSATVTGAPPDSSVKTGTTSCYGQISGTSVTIDIGLHTDHGVLSGASLTLNVAQPDGSIRPIAYRRATPSDYNGALATLNSTMQHTDARAQNVSDQAKAISKLTSDYQALGQQKSRFKGDLSSLNSDLGTATYDLSSEHADEKKAITEAHNGTDNNTMCSDANSVEGDANGVEGDANGLSGDLNSTKDDLASARSSISTLASDLQAVQQGDPGFSGTADAPAPGAVSQAIADARKAISQAVRTANSGIDQMNDVVATAHTYAVDAANAGNCNPPNAAASAIDHIT